MNTLLTSLFLVVVVLLFAGGVWALREAYRAAQPTTDAPETVLRVPHDDLYRLVQHFVADAETRYTNGQTRWHYVYGNVLQAFPARKRDIGPAIEAVLRDF